MSNRHSSLKSVIANITNNILLVNMSSMLRTFLLMSSVALLGIQGQGGFFSAFDFPPGFFVPQEQRAASPPVFRPTSHPSRPVAPAHAPVRTEIPRGES